jgi:septal ring factor EnvC (AmiA/AmiB activator)
VSHNKLAMALCREAIKQLDRAQEFKELAQAERQLIKTLKLRLLGLAAIERSWARQKARITWLRLEDANSKFFHMMANARKKKKIHPYLAVWR